MSGPVLQASTKAWGNGGSNPTFIRGALWEHGAVFHGEIHGLGAALLTIKAPCMGAIPVDRVGCHAANGELRMAPKSEPDHLCTQQGDVLTPCSCKMGIIVHRGVVTGTLHAPQIGRKVPGFHAGFCVCNKCKYCGISSAQWSKKPGLPSLPALAEDVPATLQWKTQSRGEVLSTLLRQRLACAPEYKCLQPVRSLYPFPPAAHPLTGLQ